MSVVSLEQLWPPFAAMLSLAVIAWGVSLRRADVSIVDSLWSMFFILFALLYAWRAGGSGTVVWVTIGLVMLWGLRLSAYITWRNHGKGEDRRYQAIRARNQPHFEYKSLYLVFLLQAALALIVAMPLTPLLNGAHAANVLTYAGFALALCGTLFESVADWQMARFKAGRGAEGEVMDRGLWRYSRHPNYFGEALVWWGVWLASASVGGAWTVFSPILMNWLLLRVSGVPLLEKDLPQRRPAYREYLRTTSRFIPMPPKKPQKR